MRRSYIIGLIITISLFFLIFREYYDHLEAFERQVTIEAQVLKTNCGRRSNIDVQVLSNTESISLIYKFCTQLKVNDKTMVIQGKSGNFYWNEKPTKRIFWLIPVYLIIIGYMIYWHIRESSKKSLKKS